MGGGDAFFFEFFDFDGEGSSDICANNLGRGVCLEYGLGVFTSNPLDS